MIQRARFDDALRAVVLRRVANAPRFAGATVKGSPPILCVNAPPSLRRGDLEKGIVVLPWGWDSLFGGVLTFAVMTKSTGYLGRVVVRPSDEVFPALEQGRYVMAIVANETLLDAFSITTTDLLLADFSEQWTRVRDHKPILEDPVAAPWEVLNHQRMVVEKRLQPRERLTLGWVAKYATAVNALQRTLAEAPAGVVERAQAIITRDGPSLGKALLRVIIEHGLEVSALVKWTRELRVVDPDGFVLFLLSNSEIHDVLHELGGVHSPLCMLHMHLTSVELLAPYTTEEGQIIRWLSKSSGQLESIKIEPSAFPQGLSPEMYWQRINIPLPWNWGAFITGRDVHADFTVGSDLWKQMPRAEDPESNEDAADALLAEAVSTKKWVVPPGAEIALPIGPFARLTAWEVDDEVFFVFRTSKDEFAIAALEPQKSYLTFSGDFGIEPSEAVRIDAAMKLLLSAVVRDFFVVEEREKVFGHRQVERLRARKTEDNDGPRIVYLPRIRYTSNAAIARCRSELGHSERGQHEVTPHLRKSLHASDHQLWLARTYGFSVPQGYTFVRPHRRGDKGRDVLYRSRSALAALYDVSDATSTQQPEPAPWFRFERDVARLLASLGFAVEHVAASRRGDGGVDVYATKGDDLDAVRWVIQCKCFALTRSVGPHIVRELAGAVAGYPQGTRGMLITTSTFSEDAQTTAARLAIRLMDGVEFAERLRSCDGR